MQFPQEHRHMALHMLYLLLLCSCGGRACGCHARERSAYSAAGRYFEVKMLGLLMNSSEESA